MCFSKLKSLNDSSSQLKPNNNEQNPNPTIINMPQCFSTKR